MAVPYTFGSATTSIPLSQLDSNFATTITLGNTAIQLGNTVTTLNNMTMANVTVSSASTPVPEAAGGTGTTTGYYGFKNRIINGAMGISQRTAVNTNVAVGTGTSGTFGPDRFSGYTGTASLWNILQVSTGVYDFPYALRLQRIVAQTSTSAIYLRQLIETNNCIDLAGQSVTLSFYATAGANYSGGSATLQLLTGTAADQGTTSLNTGAWTGAVTPINSTFTPTTARTKFTFTGTFGSNIQEVAFSISWAGSGTAGANDYIDVTGVQLEKGSTATSFDYRPYGTELQLCQRYFEKMPTGASGYASVRTTDWYGYIHWQTEKRTAPTITLTGVVDLIGSIGDITNQTPTGIDQASVKTARIYRTGSSFTSQAAFIYVTNNIAISSEL